MISRQRKRQRQKKIVVAVAFAVCIVLLFTYFVVGSYFYNVMLNPNDQKPLIDIASQKSIITGDVEGANAVENEIAAAWANDSAKEEWSITDDEGLTLRATYYKPMMTDSHTWAIVFHGYAQSSSDVIVQAKRFYDQGYNVLTPDLRAHGRSEGLAYGMGWIDRADVVRWAQKVVETDSEAQIALYGVSIGANAVMMACGEERLPRQVFCAIGDSGYSNAWDLFSQRIRDVYNMNEFFTLHASDILVRIRGGYSLKYADTAEALKNSRLPILFIAGDEDTIVPRAAFDELYEQYEAEKSRIIIQGAAYAKGSTTNPELYWRAVFDFIREHSQTEDE